MKKLIQIQEERSRRHSIQVEGVVDPINESWGVKERKLQQLFQEHLGLNDIFIERAHKAEKRGQT